MSIQTVRIEANSLAEVRQALSRIVEILKALDVRITDLETDLAVLEASVAAHWVAYA